MSKGGEQLLAQQVTKWLAGEMQAGRLWFLKVHGGPYQRAGVWDYLITVNGRSMAVELKNPNGSNTLSPTQVVEGRRMERASVRMLAAATTLREVQDFVNSLA